MLKKMLPLILLLGGAGTGGGVGLFLRSALQDVSASMVEPMKEKFQAALRTPWVMDPHPKTEGQNTEPVTGFSGTFR